MQLTDIVLEQVSEKEFGELHNFWYDHRHRRTFSDMARIITPLRSPDYRSLMREFLEHEYSDRICVNCSPGIWKRYAKRNMKEGEIDEIIKLVQNNKEKKGHFELCFRRHKKSKTSTEIKIVEFSGELVGYALRFHNVYANLFHWITEPKREGHVCFGLWVPTTQSYKMTSDVGQSSNKIESPC